ncbi:hypothetical protein [Vibrio sp. D431a]|uniref:hypothetical protein n=1 Tax=Vibrio sp. D431a TaxID=2837388 RepID=UPI002555ADBB|nr:hypothetical protein [Vibrio sp. D431a]MDK9789853.1 hypothetical protein [Vibrio sp. D431a]
MSKFVIQPNGLICFFDFSIDNFNGYNLNIREALSASVNVFGVSRTNAYFSLYRVLNFDTKTQNEIWSECLETVKLKHKKIDSHIISACTEKQVKELGELPENSHDYSIDCVGELTDDSITIIVQALELCNGGWRYVTEKTHHPKSIELGMTINERYIEIRGDKPDNNEDMTTAKQECLRNFKLQVAV